MLDLKEAEAWMDAALVAVGAQRTSELETFRARPWGVVLRAETSDGVVWMKEPRGATAFEVPLYWLLAECAPEAILVPLAVDEERGWVLLPDGGTSLGERADGEELVQAMASALGRYARVQRALEPRVDDLRRTGIADMTPGAMPARFDEAIKAGARYSRASGDPADAESLERVAGHRATFVEWCEELASRPGGVSLDHNDLHPWNVLGSPDRPEGLRFYDWGDGVIAHPFATTLVPLGVIARLGSQAVERLRDAYLEPFADVASREDLIDTLELACRVAKVARALTWERALLAGDETSTERDFRRAPLESLESLLDDSYLGNT
jgi:hypothetical protein